MNLSEIERELGKSFVDAILYSSLAIVSENAGEAGYQRRIEALQCLLAMLLALGESRICAPDQNPAEQLELRVRAAFDVLRQRELADRDSDAVD